MNYEKAYKESVKKLRYKISDNNGNIDDKAIVNVDELQDIFPELQESEDERLWKQLLNWFKDCHWDSIDHGTLKRDDIIAWLEKQGEQKPTDKVETKSDIEKGKWYVCNTPRYTDFVVGKAYYCPKNGMLKPNGNEMARYVAKHCFHLWTIQDAKDGDVLAFNDGHGNDCIELIKSITDKKIEFWFCLTNGNDYEVFDGITPYTNFASREDATPATKEQRDLLFSKMKEAGYEWDVEKKELRKIEQKPAWSEEDEKMWSTISDLLWEGYKLSDKKVSWDKIRCWLLPKIKFLKDRYTWKPSEEQAEAIRIAAEVGTANNSWTMEKLKELYEQLKNII